MLFFKIGLENTPVLCEKVVNIKQFKVTFKLFSKTRNTNIVFSD